MRAFRAGRSSYFASIFRPRIDRILFAATKADHLHHKSHDRLEAILRALTAKAIARAEGVGAEIDVIALAAVRATREAEIRTGGETLDAIIGVPEKGETIGGQTFDGIAEAAVFPGELPADPDAIFEGDAIALPEADNDWRFVRFRPPLDPARRARAADPARPRAAIPDRGSPRMSQRPPRPRAFRLDDSRVAVDDQPASLIPEAIIRSQNDPIPAAAAARRSTKPSSKIEAAQKSGLIARSRLTLGGLVWTGLGGLVSLALGLWATNLIEGLFAKAESLGIIGVVFGLVLLVGLIGVAAREIIAVARQTRIAEMHVAFAEARAADDRAAARRSSASSSRSTATGPRRRARAREVEEATRAIIDGRDLIDVAERALLRPLDDRAQGEIAAAAKRVSLVTAISPRAILDVVFVVAQIVRLVRRIAEIYGGRPGLLGLIKLARSVGAHIAITGGMAVGDSLLQQVVGHGIASRISARMGEGVLNGLLTTRVGLSALAVCRPMPFAVDKPPGVSDVAPFLFSKGEEEAFGAKAPKTVIRTKPSLNPPARARPGRRAPARRCARRTNSPAGKAGPPRPPRRSREGHEIGEREAHDLGLDPLEPPLRLFAGGLDRGLADLDPGGDEVARLGRRRHGHRLHARRIAHGPARRGAESSSTLTPNSSAALVP